MLLTDVGSGMERQLAGECENDELIKIHLRTEIEFLCFFYWVLM